MTASERPKITRLRSIWSVTRTEFRKAFRSPMFLITVIGMAFMPMMLGVLMFIKKYPELARSTLMLTKATMIPGNADWHTYLGLFAQIICSAGLLIFGFVASWLFGREYSDRTVKDLLALPLPRSSIVYGKFIVMACWSGLLFAVAMTTAFITGGILGLTGWSFDYGLHCTLVLSAATLMNVGLCMFTSFIACWTRGYLAAVGFVIVTLILGNFVGMLGFGPYYPWGIPALYGMKGVEGIYPGISSIIIVTATSFLGLIATLLWWRYADQT